MAFFKKLKDRLFKSSSKLDAGLEAIVDEAPVPVEGAQADLSVNDLPEDDHPDRSLPENPLPVDKPIAAERPAEEPHQGSEALAVERVDRAASPSVSETAQPAPEAISTPDPTKAGHAESEPAAAADESTADDSTADENTPDENIVASATRSAGRAKGFLGRIFNRGDKPLDPKRRLDDDMLEQLEELLISADMGVDTAMRVTANMAEGRFGTSLSVADIKSLLAQEITRIMEPVAKPLPLYAKKPQVVLVVGVNGSGKTTTIGKLASQFKTAGKTVVIAAGDTFRAAAVEQLQIWGDRAGVPVLTAPEGSDPASLAFDAMTKAEADGADLLMIDTAGRLQNRADLMEELAKIVRVIRKKDPEAPHNTLLVLDATTGQNAVLQVETFQRLADVSGLVMTKLDGTAKGGVLVALADKFGLPIHAIGVGEQIDDLAPFDPEEFAAALTGTRLGTRP
ncbi:signal recognition particle-docking protein FtsY [Paracoccaceae bacterium]|nr:signal recognition particle-docking protein FtsY [Paracoccaceae bacterium]